MKISAISSVNYAAQNNAKNVIETPNYSTIKNENNGDSFVKQTNATPSFEGNAESFLDRILKIVRKPGKNGEITPNTTYTREEALEEFNKALQDGTISPGEEEEGTRGAIKGFFDGFDELFNKNNK